jgi:23S rRNA pseudouridine1911/1915/1917 synthase
VNAGPAGLGEAADGEPAEGDEDEDELVAEGGVAASPLAERPLVIEHKFFVENECHGFRLDRFLQKKMRRMSRSRIQRVIEGDCDVDGRPARSGARVLTGQTVSFRRPAPTEPEVPRHLSVRHVDPDFYVLDKPSGLPIHPTARYHYSTLTAVLRERFPDETLWVAHRLDRETSGLLLVARTKAAESTLKKAFARRLVQKRYLAIVHGALEIDEAQPLILEQPIGPAGTTVRVRMAVCSLQAGGLTARTEVRTVQRAGPYTLVECRPHTGRQHQIRVHLWHAGYPIVGDKLYPDEEVFLAWTEGGDAAVRDRLPLLRHALHAAGLQFPHPVTGAPITVDSPLPAELAALLGAAE